MKRKYTDPTLRSLRGRVLSAEEMRLKGYLEFLERQRLRAEQHPPDMRPRLRKHQTAA